MSSVSDIKLIRTDFSVLKVYSKIKLIRDYLQSQRVRYLQLQVEDLQSQVGGKITITIT